MIVVSFWDVPDISTLENEALLPFQEGHSSSSIQEYTKENLKEKKSCWIVVAKGSAGIIF